MKADGEGGRDVDVALDAKVDSQGLDEGIPFRLEAREDKGERAQGLDAGGVVTQMGQPEGVRVACL